jgi:hypothetical protein
VRARLVHGPAAQALDDVADFRHRLGAPGRILLEASHDERRQRRRQIRAPRNRRSRGARQQRPDHDHRIRPVERPVSRGHLVQEHAEGEDVGSTIFQVPLHAFRRHVGERADLRGRCRRGQDRRRDIGSRGDEVVRAHPRESEVDDLHAAIAPEHDVAGFEVTVRDAAVVRGIDGCRDLSGECEQAIERKTARRQ